MKAESSAFSRSYRDALGRHLAQDHPSSQRTSLSLGRRALKLGLETLDLARIHEEALDSIESSRASGDLGGNEDLRRATGFFSKVITPLEETHQGARDANAHMKIAVEALSRRTKELAALNEELTREIEQRHAAEVALRASESASRGLLERSQQMQEELKLLSHRLLSIQENERQRISRELHDVVAQALAGLNMQLATLRKQSKADAKDYHEKIADTQRLVKKAVDSVHRFARDLRPTALDDLGLIAALESHMKEFMETTGVRVAFTAFAELENLNIEVRTVLFRVTQEALQNIGQHAKASRAVVSIRQDGKSVCMEIKDNGKGFALEGGAVAKNERLGLLGMRERVEMIGGRFFIESAEGSGTTVRVEVPCGRVRARKRSSKSPKSSEPQTP